MGTPLQIYPARSSEPETFSVSLQIEGAGSSAPVATDVPRGVTVTRVNTGIYRATFATYEGPLKSFSVGLAADTPADIAGHTVIVDKDSYTSTTKAVDFTFYDTTPAAHDLAAAEFISLTLVFARNNTTS